MISVDAVKHHVYLLLHRRFYNGSLDKTANNQLNLAITATRDNQCLMSLTYIKLWKVGRSWLRKALLVALTHFVHASICHLILCHTSCASSSSLALLYVHRDRTDYHYQGRGAQIVAEKDTTGGTDAFRSREHLSLNSLSYILRFFFFVGTALRPPRSYRLSLSGTGSPGRPPRLSRVV